MTTESEVAYNQILIAMLRKIKDDYRFFTGPPSAFWQI